MDIDNHYSGQMDEDALLAQLRERYPRGPTVYQLAPIDQLHIGGIKASEKLLLQLQEIQPKKILEVGSGVGGLMRLISTHIQEKDASVEITGIDITHRFNTLNSSISQLFKKDSAIRVATCDAQQLPFADNSFDCIIFQHSLLNIPNTEHCLQECRRVLDSNGNLLLHEVLQGPHPEQMRYPVPWARAAEQSHLITLTELTNLLTSSGFTLDHTDHWSEEALAWRKRQANKETNPENRSTDRIPPISPTQILGDDFNKMAPNLIANLSSGSIEVWQLSCRLRTA
ncbi:class I SAM-dependent methyltransferase [Amphritea japonica]|uniref:Methyltransferase n=1 Tax=Amphritea japonica ATCC BAA-1530 TaxID=1278309 RepID=A0A7R6P3N9_9GAMM|nr:class I SAM-dependent methyltransferase [Amphritea japonica]BBB26628.1 methyltransferase [Amphritea japonica ATCC BAA-1530]